MSDRGAAAAAKLEQQAEAARRAGDHVGAALGFREAAEATTSAADRARLRLRETHCLVNLGDHGRAEEIALDVLADRDELDPVVAADALSVVGVVKRRQGALTASMEALADALAFIERGSRRHREYPRVLHNVAVGHSRAGLWPRALALFERSLDLPDSSGVHLTLATMASAHVDIAVDSADPLGVANDHVDRARELTDRVLYQPDRDRIATVLALANQAVCRLWAGDDGGAERQAHEVLDAVDSDLEAVRAAFVLGETSLRADRWSESLAWFRRCLDVAAANSIESFPPRVFRRVAAIHRDRGDLDALSSTTTEMADWFEHRISSERADRVAHVELGVRHRLVEALSLEDPLTKLPNRRFLERWLPRALESDQRLTLAVIDLDDFKAVNDTLSYETGDRVLAEFAEVLRSATRRGDVAVRLGGDEFLLAITAVSLEDAHRAVDRLRAQIEGHDWPEGVRLTMSAGIAAAARSDVAGSMRAASTGMQRAKRAGGNRIDLAEPPGA